jgi:hypothetical protein
MDEICIRQRFKASTLKRPGSRYVCLLPPRPLVKGWARFDKFTTTIFMTNISSKTKEQEGRKERSRVLNYVGRNTRADQLKPKD